MSVFNVIALLIVGFRLVEGQTTTAAPNSTACWKLSYDRGVGVMPTECADDFEKDAGLCYAKCGAGYVGSGPICWEKCPDGFMVGSFYIGQNCFGATWD